ncbi:MAG: LPS export ABC transporter permease LptF [Deltaproteobacteria bacterium]|nr:LPS export ABC transporter permease LptF [Deltaproteobacteria bacterium]
MTRYVFKEIAVPFILSLAILSATALLSKVVKLVELAVVYGAGLPFLLRFVASVMPSFLIYTIPVSFLVAVLAAFTRLSSDSELTAMKASGLGLTTLMRPVAAAALAVAGATLLVTLYAFPWGNGNVKRLIYEASRNAVVSGIEEKTFYDKFKGVTLYVDHVTPDTGEMEGIFIAEDAKGGEPNAFFATKGALAAPDAGSSVYMKLYDGAVHRRSAAKGYYNVAAFSTYTLELDAGGPEPTLSGRTNRELYAGELAQKAAELKARGESASGAIIDLHKRLVLPASVLVFAVLAVPLGIQKVRAPRFTGFSVALGVVLLYYIASTAFESLGERGAINPVLAAWGSTILFAAAGAYIFLRAAKDAPVLPWGR